jgi:hypothetical protein
VVCCVNDCYLRAIALEKALVEEITQVLVSYATNMPIVAFMMWQLERQRADYIDRIDRKDALIDRMLERERSITDKAIGVVLQK